MHRRLFLTAAAVLPLSPLSAFAHAPMSGDKQVRDFINTAAAQYGFDVGELNNLFGQLAINRKVINLMDAPARKKTYWREYRNNIMHPRRIQKGVSFMNLHRQTLNRAAKEYGTPPSVIAAILGIETRYGDFLGNYGVMESLATLAFYYPRRAAEFRRELQHFLLYARDTGINPLHLRGSFAGAFGMPQFLPGSARRFAVDFDGDGKTDLFAPADAIGSIGKFLAAHNWRREHGILYKLQTSGDAKPLLAAGRDAGYKATLSLDDLRAKGFHLAKAPVAEDEKYLLVDLQNQTDTEYRAGTENFYTLTRYNKSFKYAAAVADLAAALA